MTLDKQKQLLGLSVITFVLILLLAIFIVYKIKEEEKKEHYVQLGRANAIAQVLATSLADHLNKAATDAAKSISKNQLSKTISAIDGLIILENSKVVFPQLVNESFFKELSDHVSPANQIVYKEAKALINSQEYHLAFDKIVLKKNNSIKDGLLFKHLKSILFLKQNKLKEHRNLLINILLNESKSVADLPWIFWESILIGYLNTSPNKTGIHNQVLQEIARMLPTYFLKNDFEYFWQKLEDFNKAKTTLMEEKPTKLLRIKEDLNRIIKNSFAGKKLHLHQLPNFKSEQSSYHFKLKDKHYVVQNKIIKDKTIFIILNWKRIKLLLDAKLNVLQKDNNYNFELSINGNESTAVSRKLNHFPAIILSTKINDNWLSQVKQRNQLYFFLLALTICFITGCLYFLYNTMSAQLILAKMRSDFVTNVSHELRTPVAAIQLMSETLSNQSITEEKALLEYYQLIHNDSQRLGNLINNVLDFSKLESGNRKYEMNDHNLLETIDQVKESLQPESSVINIITNQNEIHFKYNTNAMEQIFNNLISNSMKYAKKECALEINISIDLKENNIEIMIQDNGRGIKKEDLPNVFDKFFRGGDLTTQNINGNGLGLCIVKQLVEVHGGKVRIESVINASTTLIINFPKAS